MSRGPHIPSNAPFRLPLLWQAAVRGTHDAIVFGGDSTTYGDLSRDVDRQARRLAGCGVAVGDRVVACLPNGIQLVELLHAVARLEAVLVPLNTRLTADELAGQVNDVAPRVAVWDPAYADRLPRPGAGVKIVSSRDPVDGEMLDAEVLDTVREADIELRDTVRLDAPYTIVYTSGTTGRPKGVVLTHGNHLASSLGSAQRLGVESHDRWLAPLPMFHVGGLGVLLRSVLYGTTAVMPEDNRTESLVAALRDDDVTIVSLVPTMLARLLDAWGDRPAPPRLRAVLLGGAPVAPSLLERALRHGFPIALTYGLTEACSQVATTRPGDVRGSDLSMPPLMVTGVRIVGSGGTSLPCGREGLIAVAGPTVMAGYWQAESLTADGLPDGCLITNDIGALDERGRLTVLGRHDDTIVTGGENVHPAEIEAVLSACPGVKECCVVGVPDDEWGQMLVAVVVPERGDAMRPSDAELDAQARLSLAGYKAPRRYVWWTEALPRTSSGKVSRRRVLALLAR